MISKSDQIVSRHATEHAVEYVGCCVVDHAAFLRTDRPVAACGRRSGLGWLDWRRPYRWLLRDGARELLNEPRVGDLPDGVSFHLQCRADVSLGVARRQDMHSNTKRLRYLDRNS